MTKASSMKPDNPRILTINGGSSSIKFALFEAGDPLKRILEGGIDRIGLSDAAFRVKGLNPADNFSRPVTAPDHTVTVDALMDWIAVYGGKSVDTSMSFTPTAGVPMSTRSGDLDPGLIWYLARTEGIDDKRFNEMVNFQSGLLGVSETSSDMRDLLDRETQDVRAAEAIALFCYQVKKWIGGFAAALGGLDTLVFAGGIGENAPTVRARICEGLGFLGIELEEKSNAANAGVISAVDSHATVRVIRTDEEWMIANTVCRVLGFTIRKELYHENKKGV